MTERCRAARAKKAWRAGFAACCQLAIFVCCGDGVAAGTPFTKLFSLAGQYPLGESVNRTDYESIDAAARRLYISKMGGGQLLVFDIARNRLVAQLDGFPKITGVLAVPEIHRVYASIPGSGIMSSIFVGLGMAGLSRGRGTIAVLDSRSLAEVARLPGGIFPDGIAYDSKDHRVFVSDELGSGILGIDGLTNIPQGRIATDGEVGNVRYDGVTKRVYVPVQSNNELAVIDPTQLRILARYNLPGCEHPHGFIVTPNAAVGFVACDGNDRLVAVNLATGRMLDVQPVAHDPDVLAIDPQANRLYVAAESGNLSSFDIADAYHPRALGEVYVGEAAHAVAVDPVTHRLYFALADVNSRTALMVLEPKSPTLQ